MLSIKTSITFLFTLSILQLGCSTAAAPVDHLTDTSAKTAELEELMDAFALDGNFNGSVLVAHEGEILFEKGYGFANLEWDIPNAPDTKHRIASITKQFTAMLILQLVAENKLELDVPISTYLPEYNSEHAAQVNIHQLLTHTSGIPDYGRFSNYREFERNRHRPWDIVSLFADLPLNSSPGEAYSYCNSGYVLLGVIIEEVTQQRYSEVLQDKILTPLGMVNTGYDDQWQILKNRAAGYYRIWGQYRNMNYLDMSLPYAAGGMYSTVEDLHIWDQALYTEQLLPQSYLDLMFGQYAPTRGRHYGYGWFISELAKGSSREKVESVSHGGGMDGFRTLITRIPSSKSAIILLSNTESGTLNEMTVAINGVLFDQPYEFPKISTAYALLKAIEKDGIAKGIELFEALRNDDTYYIDEQEMVIVGYDLLGKSKAEEAAFVFELGIQAFPDAFNVYDSYGEALMALGEHEKAIANYRKSVELNPDNENGKQKLRELGVSY